MNRRDSRSNVDLDSLLAEAHQAVLSDVSAKAAPAGNEPGPPRGRPHVGWLTTAIVSWAVVAVALISSPGPFKGPTPKPFAPPDGQLENSLRWGLWLANGRVEGHRREAGRLPDRLMRTGFGDRAISLEVLEGGNYRLRAIEGGVELELASNEDPTEFLGSALDELQRQR